MTSPCMNCDKRHTACHSNCDIYKDYLLDVHTKKEWIKNKNKRVSGFSDTFLSYLDKQNQHRANAGRRRY